MRITSLTLRDLRRYVATTIELAPGLTIVRGPNEAGKSTLQRAIELALTRKATSAAGDLDGLVRWDGAAEARTAIEMAFTYEDEEGGSHTGRLEKSFRGAKGLVRLELDGEVITDPARADEELASLSGVPTEGFFRSTASIPCGRARSPVLTVVAIATPSRRRRASAPRPSPSAGPGRRTGWR